MTGDGYAEFKRRKMGDGPPTRTGLMSSLAPRKMYLRAPRRYPPVGPPHEVFAVDPADFLGIIATSPSFARAFLGLVHR